MIHVFISRVVWVFRRIRKPSAFFGEGTNYGGLRNVPLPDVTKSPYQLNNP